MDMLFDVSGIITSHPLQTSFSATSLSEDKMATKVRCGKCEELKLQTKLLGDAIANLKDELSDLKDTLEDQDREIDKLHEYVRAVSFITEAAQKL